MILLSSFSFIQTWFTQGLLHPLQTPSHLLLIISIGFLIGQNGSLVKHLSLLVLSLIVGLILNDNISLKWDFELIILVLALIISLFVVLRLKQIKPFVFLFVIICGLMLGYDSSPIVIPGLGSNSIFNWLLGAAISMVSVISILSVIAIFLRRYWNGIVLRVIGSWIATRALFTLTLQFAKI